MFELTFTIIYFNRLLLLVNRLTQKNKINFGSKKARGRRAQDNFQWETARAHSVKNNVLRNI